MDYQLSFYVPTADAEKVKTALFSIGVGRQGDYDNTCWQCLGTGQFRPLTGASPTIGEMGELTYVEEYKIEMVCSKELIQEAVKILKEVHPYEEPAYCVYKLERIV
jgi:structural hemagglutinin/hemolysin toxin protein RtxA